MVKKNAFIAIHHPKWIPHNCTMSSVCSQAVSRRPDRKSAEDRKFLCRRRPFMAFWDAERKKNLCRFTDTE